MLQTAIVIDVEGGRQVLVRIFGEHVASDKIHVDSRDDKWGRWFPDCSVEVRHEGKVDVV